MSEANQIGTELLDYCEDDNELILKAGHELVRIDQENQDLIKENEAISAVLARKILDLKGLRHEEKSLSGAYLRLRALLNAFDTAHAPSAEAVWQHTEKKLSNLIAENASLKAQFTCASTEAFGYFTGRDLEGPELCRESEEGAYPLYELPPDAAEIIAKLESDLHDAKSKLAKLIEASDKFADGVQIERIGDDAKRCQFSIKQHHSGDGDNLAGVKIINEIKSLSQTKTTIDDLEAERDELAKDAARYRWLRNQTWYESCLAVVTNPKKSVKLGTYCPSHELLDSFIDGNL